SYLFFFSSRRRHTRFSRDWSSDVCSSDLAAFATWNDVNCSNLNIIKRPDVGIGYSALLNTGDEVNDPFYADISTIGFIPPFIFDAVLGPGASQNVLAVTLTFVWVDENDNPLDMNGDGYLDTALAEIWYNDG